MTVQVPEEESQFRLRPCASCGCKGVGYQQRQEYGKPIYRVVCPGCRARTQWRDTRHGAQLEWNGVRE